MFNRLDPRKPFLGRLIPSAVLASMSFGAGLQAQTSFGTIVGTVTDASGATVAGARVVLKNTATNATKESTTSGTGTYTFVNLLPGSYEVTASGTGFKSTTNNHVDVTIGGTTRIDETLETGEVTETVSVSANAEALQTDSVSLGGVVEGRQVTDSPLNGRNVINLLEFIPGVVPGGGTQGSTVSNGSGGNASVGGNTQAIAYGNYQIGGGFSGQSLFFIDGVGQNVPENNVNSLVPTQDSVQEFRVSTNNVSAEFGGYGGGVIQISTKSGTNAFHGTAYEFFRNTALNANNWFSNHDGLGKSPLHQNQYGGNLGGPLVKNKAFFFFSFERESLTSSSPTNLVVPTAAELNGDFSGDPQIIYDPLTGQPFPGNKIDPSRLDPTALKILSLETPDQSRVIQQPFSANAFASAPIAGFQNQYNGRADWAVTSADNVFAKYTFWNPHNNPSDPFGTRTGLGVTGNTTQEGVLGDTHVFNATTTADLRLSYLNNFNFQSPLSLGFDQSSINANYGALQAQTQGIGALPALGIQGYGIGAGLSQLYWNNSLYAINGSATKILGAHTVKAGGNWRQVLWTTYPNSGGLTINATPFFTASSPSDATTGNALASFLLNAPSSTSATSIVAQHSFLHNYGFYITDTYQATKSLTITAGLRWDQPGAYSEVNDLGTVLQPNAPVTIGTLSSITNPVTGTAQPLTGQLALLNSPAYHSRREEQLHYDLFSPRVGFAYRVNDKSVVRAGYGISYLPAEYTQDGPQLSTVGRSTTVVTNNAGQSLISTIDNPFPNGIIAPSLRDPAGLNKQIGNGLWARIPEQKYGYVQQWNLAVERALDTKTTATVSYAGAKGSHLVGASAYTASGLNLNQLPDQYQALGADLQKQVANPFYGQVPAGTLLASPTIAQGYLLLPHPQYPSGVLAQAPRFGSSSYHALQATFTRRFEHQGIVQVAYTWAKLLSNVDNTSAFQDGQGGGGVVQDNYNLQAEKSVSEQNLTSNLVINYGINLPFGNGEAYLHSVNKGVNAIVGGWRVNGITIIKSGLPLAFTAASNGLSQFGGGTAAFGPGPGIIRPSYTAGCAKQAPGDSHSDARVNHWFNTSCFTQPANFSFGNEPRVDPSLKSEGLVNFDVSANKNFQLTEALTLRFGAEIFDLFNHAQFGLPNQSLASPNFGLVTGQLNLPRTVQLSLRVSY